MSSLAYCIRTILLDPDDLALVRKHVEMAGNEEAGVRAFLAELQGELEGLRQQLVAQGFDVTVVAPEEEFPALIATSLQTGKTTKVNLKTPKEKGPTTGDLFGSIEPTAPAEAARNWKAEGDAAFKAGKARMVPRDIWQGVSAGEGNKRADAWLKGWDLANLAAPLPDPTRDQFIKELMNGMRVTAKGRTFSLKDRGKLGWTVIEHYTGYQVEKGPGPMESWGKGFAAERAAEEVGLTPGTGEAQIAPAPKEGTDNGPDAGEGLRTGSQEVSGTAQPGAPQEPAGPAGVLQSGGQGSGADAQPTLGPDAGSNQQSVQGPAAGPLPEVAGAGSNSGDGGRNRNERPDPAAVDNNVEAEREIALPPNYQITDDDHIGEGGPKAKVAANLEALRLLKQLEAENRKATPSEQAVLVRYVGWGAFAQDMFQDTKPEWAKERTELKSLLTPEEYDSARASVLNAHYTSADVINGMWDALKHLGFKGGRALEPASGVGHFLGLTPASMRDRMKWTTTELDKVTGAIAKQLYQRADVNVQGFETLNRPNGFYDLAMSNVPFGSFNIRDLRYKQEFLIHDYFFVRSLDLVRPGGIVAFITSSGTMDKANDSARAEIMKRADLVGAIRLPGGKKGAFAGNAGTEVTTDIIFLRRKGERIPPIENAWQNTKEIETPDGPVRINEYFADHPDMMLGQMRLTGSMYREKSPVLEGDATDIRTKILAAAQKMMQGAFIEAGAAPVAEPKVIDAETSGRIKEGAFYVDGAKVMRKVMGLGTDPGLNNTDQEKVKGLIDMRDTVSQLLDVNRDRSKDALARQRLNKLYDAFVKKFGPINKETVTTTTRLNKAGENIVIRRLPNMSAFRADPDAYKVAAIENYDAEKGTATKAALFKGEVVSDSPAAEIKNATDGIGWSLNAFGEVNLTAIADRLGKSKKQVIDELGDRIFLNPNGDRWEPAEQYLAGDVVEKLDDARAAAQADKAYERNVAALEAVQPAPLTQEEITVPFGASWVMPSVYEQFLEEVIGTQGKARVSLNPVTKQYLLAGVNFSISAQTQFGTSKVNVAEIISLALQMKSPRVVDTVKTTEGTKDVVNEEATREAQVKSNLVRKLFEGNAEEGIEGWVWQDADRAELLARVYNRKFNRLVPQKFDGGHLTLPGLATKITDGSGNVIPFALRDHQKAAVWRAIQNGNTLLDHVVGAGKTFTMIAAAMEMKRLGQIQRPMFIVPNHMLEQFSREFLQAYPNANILVAQKDEMTRANRKAFAAKIAAERWDGIVITHDSFGRLPLSKEVYVNFMKAEIEEIEAAIRHMKAAQNKKDPTVKQLEQMKKRAETRLKKLIASERKDEGVLFEELGVDQLILDEAHLFKNLAFYTQHTRVKGLSQAASQRAMDLFLKVRELEKTRPGRSSIFATGTPISNTMAEMYTMQRYLQLDELVKLGIDRFDAWASTFGEIRTNMELSPDGRTFRETSSFSRFRNLPELVALYSKMADTKTADMLNLPRPKLKGGKPIIVEAEPSLREEDYIASLVARAESVRGKKAEKGGDNMLKVVSEGRKVALDFRLIDPEYQDQNPQGKVAKMVENVTRIWRDGTDDPVAKAQLIFLDMGVPFTEDAKPAPKPETEITDDEDVQDEQDADEVEEVSADESEALRSRYNLYEEIRRNLVKQGIPRAQIAFIHEAKDDSKKAALFEKVRRGEVRILLGSTSKMGVGTNVQKRLKAMHHLDAPWKPAEVEQRDGRILRQGNMNPEIEIYRYITKRSFDSFMWQTLERKSNFIAQIKAGARGVRIAEDIDSPLPEAAELKAAASGDPRIMQHAELTKELRDLEAQFASHVRTIGQARKDYMLRQEELAGLEKRVFKMVEDAAKVPVTSGDKFKVEVLVGQKGEYTKRAEAGAVVAAFLQEQAKLPAQTISELKVANFNGLNIIARLDTRHDTPAIKMFVEGYLGRGVEFGLSIDRTPQLDAALMSRMESELADLVAAKSHTEYRIEQIRKELPKVAAAAEDRAFPRMERLKAAKNELAELTKALGEEKNKKPSGPRIMGMAGIAPPFYSALARTVTGLKMAKAPASQWIATLKNQPGVKQEEMDWLGVADWLNAQPGAVTKEALADFINSNQVQVEEVVKGDLGYAANDLYVEDNGDGTFSVLAPDGEQVGGSYESFEEANAAAGATEAESTKFSQYQLPGGENYREMLLTLPTPPDMSVDTTGWKVVETPGNFAGNFAVMNAQDEVVRYWEDALSDEDMIEQTAEDFAKASRPANWFKSGHWSEPNVLAHVRFNEREADGKRVLFIEEIQSDWHQQGRKKGYRIPESAMAAMKARASAVLAKKINPFTKYVRVQLYENGKVDLDQVTTADVSHWERMGVVTAEEATPLHEYISAADDRGYTVPDAPFKTTWPELALKRMIRWAAENGFDSIAWTPGEVQADRYNLSRVLDGVNWTTRPQVGKYITAAVKGSGFGSITTNVNGKIVIAKGSLDSFEGKNLDEVFGKDLAEKIMNEETGELEGEGLRIGGQGMKAFYDKMLVDTAHKLGKKFGAKVGRTTIDRPLIAPEGFEAQVVNSNREQWGIFVEGALRSTHDTHSEAETQSHQYDFPVVVKRIDRNAVAAHTLPITPDMRRTALNGVPLFTAKRPSAPAFTDEQFATVKSKMEKLAQQILKRRIDVTLIKTMPRELSDEFLAFYDANSRSIMISMKAAYDLAAAVGHESLHALRDAGVINAAEWESLRAQANKLGYRAMVEKQYGDLYRDLYGKEWGLSEAGVEDKIDEEAVAYMMGDYTDAKEKMTTFAQKVIDRLMEWARAVVDMMKGEGITAEQVMADIYRGKIANRLASPEGQVMQPAAAVAASATPSQRKSAEAAASPLKKVLELAVQGFGYKIVDTGLPFGYTDRWGKFWSFGTQIIDKAIPGDKIGKWMDSGWKASPELRAYIKENMTAPWAHRVWFGHDPLANLSAFIDKFGVAALPEWGVQLFKDSMTKAGIPLPGTQWLVQSGLVGDRFATAWLSMNIGEALSGGMSILGTYRLMKQVKNGEPVHKGWAVAGILFKLVGGTLSANPVVLLSAAADTAILVKATAADVRDGLQQVEQGGKKGRMPMAAPTESEAFKRWFGDSKVVDAQGRPLVVYHGTGENFDSFDPVAEGIDGIYFSSSPEIANQYAAWRGRNNAPEGGDNVVPVFLAIKNPLIVEDMPEFDSERQWSIIETAKAAGHDGVILRNIKDGWNLETDPIADTYIVFSPTQIKSIHNPGTWDPSNPRIMGMATPDGSMGGGGAVPPKAAAIDAAAQEELDDLAGNIRLSRLNAPDDIKEMLKDVANKAEGFMSERRGIVSNEQTAALAAELGMTAEELMQRDTGTAFNAQQIFAARVLLLKSAERLKKLAREARTSNSLSTLAQFQKAVTLHRAIQEQVAGMTAEAGRALQQFNMIAAKDSLRAMDALLNGVRNNKASKGAKLGGPNEEARELADMISEMDDPAKLGKFIADMQKATVWDMIREAWINGLLSGPRTHAANILSNTLTALWQVPETFVAEQIGRLHGGDKVQSGEAAARLVGLIEGTKEGIAVGAKHIRHGEALDAISKAELIERKAIPGKVGNIVRMPSRILEAEDQVFKAINYRAEINALALRQAMKEGHRGPSLTRRVAELRANPTHKMQHAAHQAALYQTYQNKLGVKGQWVMNLREAVPLGWLIMPFIRTPANILKYAAERTPLGLLMKPVRENLSGANGTVARDVQLARIALGSAVMVAVVGMAIAGHLTGGPPDDPEEERILRATGWQPYSLRIGDTYYSYQRMDPMALVVGLAADTVMLSKHLGEADLQKTAHMLVMAVANNVKEKTWISGLVTFAEAFFSGDAWKLDAWGRRLGSSVVPAFVAQYAQSQDPYIREAKTLTDAIKARVPGWSETLLARRDVFGEKMMREGALGPDIASPFFVSVDKDNPVAQAMLEIGYYPSMPDRKLAGHELTAQQYDRYVELSGKTATTMLRAAIAKPSWKRMSRDQREEKIREEFSEARKMARAKLKREWPELRKKASEE